MSSGTWPLRSSNTAAFLAGLLGGGLAPLISIFFLPPTWQWDFSYFWGILGILALAGIVGGLVGRGLAGLLAVVFGAWAGLFVYLLVSGRSGGSIVFVVVPLTTGLAYPLVRGVARLLATIR